MKKANINVVHIVGRLTESFKFDHICGGTKMYKSFVAITRDSGTEDIIPIIITQSTLNKFSNGKNMVNVNVKALGRLSSYSEKEENHNKLYIFIKANSLELVNKDVKHVNEVILSGYICKPVNYRVTQGFKDDKGKVIRKEKRITDIFLAVNTKVTVVTNKEKGKCECKRSYYIPCIAWNKEADYASYLEVGNKICLKGRIQSRTYTKKVFEEKNSAKVETELRTAYEVSINEINQIELENEGNVEVIPNFDKDNFTVL